MKTVNEVSTLTGVTVRTLQYYDTIGLLPPAERTEAGYRLYDDAALSRLQQILLFKELGFQLGEIKTILDNPLFDRDHALMQQIELLTMQRDRLDRMIALARKIKQKGVYLMEFEAFDKQQIEDYKKRARAQWGKTAAYQDYETHHGSRSEAEEQQTAAEFLGLFAEFGKMRDLPADSETVQAKVEVLKDFITAHYYLCNDEILAGLGKMYAGDSEFKRNIDKAGGEGTAEFVSEAIAVFCGK